MSSSHIDRNLLFGFLALQNNFISHNDLIAAVSVWLTDKSRPLDEILSQRRALADDERQLLEALVRKHLQKHGDDAEKSLAALSSVGKLRDDLKKLGDPDVEASLAHVAQARPSEDFDPDATLQVDPATVEKTRFRILRPHAAGGLGQVYVARDDELNRDVALKEIKFDFADDSNSRNRFLLEAEITGGLEHPGIVPVYGLGQYADGRPYYAMRFIRGDSLKEAVERFHKPGQASPPSYDSVEFRKLLGRFIDVCNAIEYAHSRGVLHRDLKPGNIMLGKYGETLVVDWGLAKTQERTEQHQQSDEQSLQPRSSSSSTATQMGSAVGSPAYMSPEQAAGRLDQLGPASDVYSLGATLYFVLTGKVAFGKNHAGDILRKVQSGDFPPPRQVCPCAPRPLEAICLKAMALRPADRYPSPQVLADDLECYLADEAVKAHRESLALRARRWLRKHPRFVGSLAATLLVGIVSALVVLSVVTDRNRQLAVANLAERNAKNEAESKRQEAEHLLVRSFIDQGVSKCLAGDVDVGVSYLWQAHERAGKLPQDDPVCNSVRGLLAGWIGLLDIKLIHKGTVSAVAFSPDGKMAVTVSNGHRLRRWDTVTGFPLGESMRSPDEEEFPAVPIVVFSPDGKSLLSADVRTVLIWDATTGKQLGQALRHEFSNLVLDAVFSPDGKVIATGCSDGAVRLWDVTTGNLVHEPLNGPEKAKYAAVAFSTDGKTVVLGTRDIRRWNVATGESIGEPIKLDESVARIKSSPDGISFVTVSISGVVWHWNADTGERIGQRISSSAPMINISFATDGRKLLTIDGAGKYGEWELPTGLPEAEYQLNPRKVQSAAFSADGRKVLIGAHDPVAHLLMCPPRPMFLNEFVCGPKLSLSDVGYSPGHTVMGLALEHQDQEHQHFVCFEWDARTLAPIGEPVESADLGKPAAVVFHAGRRIVVTLGEPQGGEIWDATSGKRIAALEYAFFESLTQLMMSPDGKTLLVNGLEFYNSPPRAALWDLTTGKLLSQVSRLNGEDMAKNVRQIAFSPDSKFAAAWIEWHPASGQQETITLWSTATGKQVGSPIVPEPEDRDRARGIALGQHDQMLVFGKFDGCLQSDLYEQISTAQPLLKRLSHPSTLTGAAFSPNGKTILAAGQDKTIRILDLATGESMGEPLDTERTVKAIEFSSDGKTILSRCADSIKEKDRVRLWDATTGKAISYPVIANSDMAIGPDGTTFLTWDPKMIDLWRMPPPLPANLESLRVQIEARTGLFWNQQGVLQQLSQEQFFEHLKRLEK